ncbi:uncharacterized protein EAE97_004369 [Botrytis byssoidea]|uniref:Uncharacterized protein n=1 Tax=Botrytis byssoidea TaxID=139641 RepID=A0A9P5M6J5_9HELO|nr:uncharacterized protein EAE97_004369 [Botrytis byssoidea]KAF7947120.1 hypothetical protein EAE97_004369 [Botrytis byssoidea]
MATAPREGAAWFLKSSLKSPGYDGSKEKDFYTWMLLEVIYNNTEDEAYQWPPPLWYPGHPRTGQQVFPGNLFSTGYVRYEYMSVMYSPSAEDIKRTYRVRSSISRGQLSRQTCSSAVCYIAVPLPTTKERFIWIDLTYPIRAFMIPAAFTAHPQYQGHAIFTRLDVRGREGLPKAYVVKGVAAKELASGRRTVEEWNDWTPHNWKWRQEQATLLNVYARLKNRLADIGTKGPAIQEPGLKPEYIKTLEKLPSEKYAEASYKKNPQGDEITGLTMRPQWTIRIDTFKSAVKASKVLADFDMAQAIDLAAAQTKDLGVRLRYEQDEPGDKFMKDLLVSFIAIGIGFIPVFGPLAAFTWSLKYEVISDTEKFTKAAGIGGKAPALTQALLHMEQGSTRSIRVDPGENTADDNSRQEPEIGQDSSNGDSEEKTKQLDSENGVESNEIPGNPEGSAKLGDAKVVDQSKIFGDETGESDEESTVDGTFDKKVDKDPFAFIIEAGEAEVYGPVASG